MASVSISQCQCTVAGGKQCGREAKKGSLYCWQHQNCKQPFFTKKSPKQPIELKKSPKQPIELKKSPKQPIELKKSPKQPIELKKSPQISKLDPVLLKLYTD